MIISTYNMHTKDQSSGIWVRL